MTLSHWIAAILLFGSIGLAAFSSIALLLVPDQFSRLHYLALVSSGSSAGVFVAVLLWGGWSQAAIKTFFVCLVLLLSSSVLTHATARAARIRDLGRWTPDAQEQIPGTRRN